MNVYSECDVLFLHVALIHNNCSLDLFLQLHGFTWDDADIGDTGYICIGNICHYCGCESIALAPAKSLLVILSMLWSHLVNLKGTEKNIEGEQVG